MFKPTRWAVLPLAGLALSAGITDNVYAQATFWDWAQGRTPYYKPCSGCDQAQSAVTPPTTTPVPTGYGTSAPTPYSNAVSTSAPAVSAPANSLPAFSVPTVPTAAYTPVSSCSSCAPVTVGYAPTGDCNLCATPSVVASTGGCTPTVRYRTTLTRVPVTYYRPVTTADPATGCPVTSLQPCTTYRWQFTRVPSTHGGLFSCWRWPWSRSEPAPAYPAAATVAPVTVMPAYTVPDGQSYAVPAQLPAGTPSPYYGTPGATLAPAAPSAASGLSPVPADSPPTLQPQAPPASGPTPAFRVPSAQPGNSIITPAPEGATLAPPQVNTETSTDHKSSVDPDTLHQPTYVKPIPDPEIPSLEPPRLLNPRERTAARLDWAVVPISWPAPERDPALVKAPEATVPATALVPAPRPAPPAPRWDDSGWRSAKAR